MSYVGKGTGINAIFNIVFRIQLTIILVIALVVSSFFNVRKAEAIAPAIPAAGAAIAALAAEIGISESALMAGIIGITAAGTGVYLLESSNQTDFISQGQYDRLWTGDLGTGEPGNWAPGYQKWKTPNGKTWEDLTPEERADYDSPADYVHSNLASLTVLFPDLFQVDGNGDLEPTPEPDPQQDPQGHSKWVKARNVLIALAAGTAGVALSDAVGMLADNAAGGIKELLFGGESNPYSLNVPYDLTFKVSNVPVDIRFIPLSNQYESRPCIGFQRENTWDTYFFPRQDVSTITLNYAKTGSYEYFTRRSGITCTTTVYQVSDGSLITDGGGGNFNPTTPMDSAGKPAYISNAYSWNFNDTANGVSASYSNGRVSGDATDVSYNYGQLSDTPQQLQESVMENNYWNTFINNYSDAGNDQTRTVVIPSFGDGTPQTQPNYQNFINVVPDTDVVPVPDDEVSPAPDPNPNPNPNPNPGTQFQEDYGQRVQRLLAQPFNQVFPFCLIGDLQDLLDLMHDAAYREPTRDVVIVNGTSRFVIPLDGFGLDGIDDFTIDLSPAVELGHMVRGFTTALFITGLLVGSFRFFLNKGGE